MVIASALETVNLLEPQSLDAVQALDKAARSAAGQRVAQIVSFNAHQEKEL